MCVSHGLVNGHFRVARRWTIGGAVFEEFATGPYTGRGRGDDELRPSENLEKMPQKGCSLGPISGVEMDLAAAGLIPREDDLVTKGFQDPDCGDPSAREEHIVETGHE